jgi:YVTN family beta-propeller protein
MTVRVVALVLAFVTYGCSAPPSSDAPASRSGAGTAAAPEAVPAPTAGRLFVTNETGGDISVVDVALRRVVATIPVGKRPRGIRLSPDGTLVYVALSGSPLAPPGIDESTLPPPDKKADGIGVVSTKELRLLRIITAGSDPEQAALTTDGRRLFVANEDVGQATAIDVEDGKVVATFPVGGEPEGVEMRPDGGAVYVTSEEDSQVSVIDVAGLKLLKTFKVGPRPRSTAFLPDSSRAYVTSENGGSIAVVNARTHTVLDTIKLTGELTRPMGAVTAPDGRRLYVSTGRGKNVIAIDTATDKPVASVEVGDRPWGIDISRDGTQIFTANGPSNDISIVDTATMTVAARVKVGERPWGIVFVP